MEGATGAKLKYEIFCLEFYAAVISENLGLLMAELKYL